MHAYRTQTCGALRAADTGKTVRLSGWIHRKRDHGGLVFVDLRDHYGLTQLVISPETPGFKVIERPATIGQIVAAIGALLSRPLAAEGANVPPASRTD